MAHNMYVLLPSEEGLRSCCSVLFRVLVFTGLVCNTTAGLACALAGSLALAAAALDSALCHITGIQCHDMLHVDVLSLKNIQSLHFYSFRLLMNRRKISAVVRRRSEENPSCIHGPMAAKLFKWLSPCLII